MIDALRWFSMLTWSVPFLLFSPALARWMLNRGKRLDALKSAVWFVALVIMGFNLRWIAFPGATHAMIPLELTVWSGLYLMSALAGLALTAAVYFDDRA